MNESPSKQRSNTPWLLLFLLILALAAGGFALVSVMDEQPAWLASLLGDKQAKSPAGGGDQTPRGQQPAAGSATGPATGSATGTITGRVESGPALPPLPAPPAPEQEAAANSAPPAEESQNAPESATQDDASGRQAEPAPQEATTPDAAGAGSATANGQDAAASGQKESSPAAPEKPDQAAGDEAQQDNVILYGKARPVTRSGNVVRGDIPEGQKAAAFVPGAALSGGDSVVTLAFVDDLARFLADNYWPQGTHTLARSRGISTASLKWANMRYGAQLKGFSGDRSRPERLRERVMAYAFMPSMIRGLYGLYGDYFFAGLEEQALARADGPQGAYFTNAQVADMFALYAGMARDLAGCVQAYRSAPGIRTQVASYADAYTSADSAFKRYMESMQAGGADKDALADRYYEAVRHRENAHRGLARALRSGSGVRLDDDSLVYAALWLYRRGPDQEAALGALEDICRDSARRLDALEADYRQQPPRQIARRQD